MVMNSVCFHQNHADGIYMLHTQCKAPGKPSDDVLRCNGRVHLILNQL